MLVEAWPTPTDASQAAADEVLDNALRWLAREQAILAEQLAVLRGDLSACIRVAGRGRTYANYQAMAEYCAAEGFDDGETTDGMR